MTSYGFDFTLRAAIRVEATSEEEARKMLANLMICADTNFGAWPNGQPATGEVSLDGDPVLFAIDDEEV